MERKPLNRSDIGRPFMFCLKGFGYIVAGYCLVAFYQWIAP